MFNGIEFQEAFWNAATNRPFLESGKGKYNGVTYIVGVAGTTEIDGMNSWNVGDWICFAKGKWHKLGSEIGTPGLSAYELAVVRGYEGTLTEWLASLAAGGGSGITPLSNVSIPTVTPGTAQVGVTLTGDKGLWAGSEPATYLYQWYRADTQEAILGATAVTYTPSLNDLGHPLRFEVRGSNSANATPVIASSAFTPLVIAADSTAAPQFVSGAAVSGTPAIGQVLVADPGVWTGSPIPTFGYQWVYADTGAGIPGAQSQLYTCKVADYGRPLRCQITGSNGVGQPVTIQTSATANVAGLAPSFTSPPSLSPTSIVVGGTVTCLPGTIAGYPTPDVAYQWYNLATLVNIAGANGSTYTPISGDAGKQLKCRVTLTNGVGSGVSAVTGNSVTVNSSVSNTAPVPRSAPLISGQPVVGNVLTASDGVWDGTPAPTFARQWFWADTNEPIAGATTNNYTVQQADIGHTLKCVVYGSNSVQQNVPASSVATAVVTSGSSTLVAPVLIQGSVIYGDTPAGSVLSGSSAVWVDDSSQLVAPTNTSLPTISGLGTVGTVLTGTLGTWSAVPDATYSQQWYRGDTAIPGATSLNYTVVQADQGFDLTLHVTAVNGITPNGAAISLPFTINDNALRTIQMPNRGAATVTLGTSLPVPFQDDFDGTDVDSAVWVEYLGWGDPNLNGALEVMCPEGNIVSDGTLKITATKEDVVESKRQTVCNYVSGIINTLDKFCFQYGYLEARFKTPASGPGYWPALWMMPVDNTWPPEIDIMEMIGDAGKCYQTLHYIDAGGVTRRAGVETVMATAGLTGTDDWHVYGLDWQATYIEWFIDDISVFRVDAGDVIDGGTVVIPNKPFYIMANMEIGGSWPGAPDGTTVFPATYEIDYIKVLATKPAPPVTQALDPLSLKGGNLALSNSDMTVTQPDYYISGSVTGLAGWTAAGADGNFTVTFDSIPEVNNNVALGIREVTGMDGTLGDRDYGTVGCSLFLSGSLFTPDGNYDFGAPTAGDVFTFRKEGADIYVQKNAGTEQGPYSMALVAEPWKPYVVMGEPGAFTFDFTNWG